jgi:ATP-dependent Clp protease adaptor protein ClpS
VHGVEILNDNTTPMEFVVTVLEQHLRMTRDAAIALMLDIHEDGGALVPMATFESAQIAAAAIQADAALKKHAFTCRAVHLEG